MNKSQLREHFNGQRNALDKKTITGLSDMVAANFFESGLLQYNSFFVYNSIKNEVNTQKIIKKLLNLDKNVYLPRVNGRHLESIKLAGQAFKKGSFGILEPLGLPSSDKIDVCLLPALAVDLSGNRLGYGGGYYDRFLKGTSCIKAALVFECQIAKQLPSEIHDVRIDMIITERRIIDLRK